jgi:hypothetical protein
MRQPLRVFHGDGEDAARDRHGLADHLVSRDGSRILGITMARGLSASIELSEAIGRLKKPPVVTFDRLPPWMVEHAIMDLLMTLRIELSDNATSIANG